MLRVSVLGVLIIVAAVAHAPAEASFPGRNGVLLASSSHCPTEHSGGCDGVRYGELVPFRSSGVFLGGAEFSDQEVTGAAWSPTGNTLVVDLTLEPGLTLLGADRLLGGERTTDPPLTRIPNTAGAAQAAFSPDSQSLVFTESEDRPTRLHVRHLRSGADAVIAAAASHPSWGVTGWIAYSRRTAPRRHDLFRVRPTGRENSRLTFRGGTHPSWAPDGRRLAFARSSGIYTIRASGGKPRRVARHGLAPIWSPDGRWIAFTRTVRTPRECQPEFGYTTCSEERIYVVQPNGKRLHVLRNARRGPRRGSPIAPGVLRDWRPIPRHIPQPQQVR